MEKGAIRVATGCYESPSIALKHEDYQCPECRREVILRRGDINIAHFSHKASLDPCRRYNGNGGGGEGSRHLNAKLILKNILETNRHFTIIQSCSMCKNPDYHTIPTNAKPQLEVRVAGGVADVYVKVGDREIIFEVFNTHAIRHRNGEWYELTCGEIEEQYRPAGKITMDCCRSWRCVSCEAEVQKIHERRIQQEACRQEQLRREFTEMLERETIELKESAKREAAKRIQHDIEKAERDRIWEEGRVEREAKAQRERDEYNKGVEQRQKEAEENRIARSKIQMAILESKKEQEAKTRKELDEKAEHYDVVHKEYEQRYLIDREPLPAEWYERNTWNDLKHLAVDYKGCEFLNPLLIAQTPS